MDIVFVDGAKAADRATRRQIRSHVMKGKNAGRVIHGRGRKQAAAAAAAARSARDPQCSSSQMPHEVSWDTTSTDSPGTEADSARTSSATSRSPGIRSEFAGQELSFFCAAESVTPAMRQLVFRGESNGRPLSLIRQCY
jgi:hypothetical protein